MPLGGRHTDGAQGTPREGHEWVADEVGGWENERMGEWECVARQTGGLGWVTGGGSVGEPAGEVGELEGAVG